MELIFLASNCREKFVSRYCSIWWILNKFSRTTRISGVVVIDRSDCDSICKGKFIRIILALDVESYTRIEGIVYIYMVIGVRISHPRGVTNPSPLLHLIGKGSFVMRAAPSDVLLLEILLIPSRIVVIFNGSPHRSGPNFNAPIFFAPLYSLIYPYRE